MASLGETLLLIAKENMQGMDVYAVLSSSKKEPIVFLKQEDAFEFARRLLNGKPHPEKKRGGARPSYTEEIVSKKREFILALCKEKPRTVKDIYNYAQKIGDNDIKAVPFGTWSGLVSLMYKKKKLGVTQKIGPAFMYVTRG